jgi:enoyl-CoA hydratase/carnithine racemase
VSNAAEIEVTENIAFLRLNHEEALNALTVELARGIADGLIELDRRDDVRSIVLTGSSQRSFYAGVDLREAFRWQRLRNGSAISTSRFCCLKSC